MASSAIELRGVSKAFGGHQVIKDLSLAVPAQSIYACLGNNGEGKSTTIRTVTGLLRPDHGGISVLGLDVQTERQAILRQIGALVDAPCFYPNLTGGEFLRIGCTLKGLRRTEIDRVLELVGPASARDRKISQFSLGMKLLVLDEPSNGLDPEGKCDMRTLLASLPAQSGVTVFVSSHNLDEVEKIATHVAVLKGGALRFQGSMADLQSRHTGSWPSTRAMRRTRCAFCRRRAIRSKNIRNSRWLCAVRSAIRPTPCTRCWCMPASGLVAGLLNGQEHRNQSWRLMLTLPVSKSQLYIAKAVLLIQQAVAWRFQSLVLPLAFGVIATMGITQIGSSEYWVWYSWTYPLTAVNGSMAAHQQEALLLAAGVGAVLLPLSAWIFGRREVLA